MLMQVTLRPLPGEKKDEADCALAIANFAVRFNVSTIRQPIQPARRGERPAKSFGVRTIPRGRRFPQRKPAL